jgi:hypothetical protein
LSGDGERVLPFGTSGPGSPCDRTEKPFTFSPGEVFHNCLAGQLGLRSLAGLGCPGEFGIEVLGQADAQASHSAL